MNRVHSWIKVLSTWCLGVLCVLAFGSAGAVTGAISTTTDVGWTGTLASGPCLNGNTNNGTQDVVNCNHYTLKSDVWFSGLPVSAALGPGTYFFAVVVPGGQGANSTANPNECTDKNLSDQCLLPYLSAGTNSDGSPYGSGDSYTNRTFSVAADGTITYSGTHDFDQPNKKIRLFPYDDTTNPGGVYILAICSLAKTDTTKFGTPGVNPSDCKYDAFQVEEGGPQQEPEALPLTVTKDASGAYNDTFTWQLGKSSDKTTVKQIGGSVTFTYTVTATPDSGTLSGFKVTGTISVFNPNVDASSNVLPVDIDGVTDQLSDGTVCTVTNGGAQTLTKDKTDFAYTCDLSSLTSVPTSMSNTVTVTWPDQILDDGSFLGGDFDDFTFDNISFAKTNIDNCITVTDPNAVTSGNPTGTLGTACVGGSTFSFQYQVTVPVPQFGCKSYDNTAHFTTNTTSTTGDSNKVTVTVCGPAQTGALTIGFWKGPNGQALITNYCTNGANNLGTYLKGLGAGSGPFSNAPTACSALASYVSGIITGASATNMNNMLKAQMLATALDVWFSGPGWTSTIVNKIKPPSNFLSHNSLGTFKMDTTAVCPMVDNLSTGSATCQNNKPSTDAVAAGAVPSSPMTMQAILDYASTTPSPYNGYPSVSGTTSSIWYGGDRTKQEILKNIFDQFNNQLAFGSF